ncbi:MAG: transcriptional regulator [Gammaproteobacteria bacterium]|nr:transcriptional regulator [Gammaproteobacteria bacterium]MCY4338588.1 transcriptional regulator [Gammaproteobacteria bacterium]
MANEVYKLRWGIERRLEFIEFRLFWEGGINRADIVSEFGVSVPQASKDLALYQEQAPDNIHYDRRRKKYFSRKSIRPRFIQPDADAYLQWRATKSASDKGTPGSQDAAILCMAQLPVPQRNIDVNVLRCLLDCVREEQSVKILYQSMNVTRPEPEWRDITPHAFGNDGLRWHVRAFCHIDRKFKDFILSRCLDTSSFGEAGAAAADDKFWMEHFVILLCPNPMLSVSQQQVIACDFAMQSGEVAVQVRRALLYYFSKRLRLDLADSTDDPCEAPVIIKNRAAFDVALAEVVQ